MTTKLGRELQTGDTIEFLSKPHTISHFDPSNLADSRIARSGEWGITIDDENRFTYCPTHAWWFQMGCLACHH